MKLGSRYSDYFPEYLNYFGRYFRLLKSVYGMTNPGNLLSGNLTEWLIESGFILSIFQMSIYYKYAPYGKIIVVLYYVDDRVYWYTPEALGKCSVDILGNILHVKFLRFSH